MKNIPSLIVCVLICLSVGGLAGFATQSSVTTWFPTLNKPFFNPPSWLFGPVWATLYTMMGVALWFVWNAPETHPQRKNGIIIFAVQLIFNFLWSFLFFGMRNPLFALFDIVFMLITITLTIIIFRKINTKTTPLLVPYLAWVSFAIALNVSIWWLN